MFDAVNNISRRLVQNQTCYGNVSSKFRKVGVIEMGRYSNAMVSSRNFLTGTVCLQISFNLSVYAYMYWVHAIATYFNANATKCLI